MSKTTKWTSLNHTGHRKTTLVVFVFYMALVSSVLVKSATLNVVRALEKILSELIGFRELEQRKENGCVKRNTVTTLVMVARKIPKHLKPLIEFNRVNRIDY